MGEGSSQEGEGWMCTKIEVIVKTSGVVRFGGGGGLRVDVYKKLKLL